MADGLKINEDLNKLFQERQGLLENHSKEMSKQISLAHALLEAQKNEKIDEVIGKYKAMNEALEEASKMAGAAAKSQSDMAAQVTDSMSVAVEGTESVADAAKKLAIDEKRAAVKISIAIAAVSAAIKGVLAQFKSLIEVIKAVVVGVFDISKAIVSIPFKILRGLITLSYEWWERVKEMAIAIEEVRKSFGDLATNEGAAIMDSFKNLNGELANTGLTVGQLFNTMQNSAEVMRYLNELAQAMGPAFNLLKENMALASKYILVYQRGLGLTNEQMAVVGQRAIAMGKEMKDVLLEISNYSIKMGKRFGIAQKLISRDITEMMGDMATFGSVGRDSMSALSVFARKLGVDFKKLLGVVKQFDDFEAAAENAAKLSQAFGLNIDAVQMMMEQDPGKRVDMVRKAFAETGRSFEQMSRQERAMLAQTAGIDESIADQVFSQKNLALSYDDILAGAKASGKQQLTQEQATAELAKSIDRAVVSLDKFVSLWDAFIGGFLFGLTRSAEWNKLMQEVQKTLWAVWRAGRLVARLFIDLFPGVKELFGEVDGFFENVRKKVALIPAVFKQFFEDLGNPQMAGAAFEKFVNNVKQTLFGTNGIDGFLRSEGLKKFLSALAFVGAGIVKMVQKGLHAIMDLIREGFLDEVSGLPKKAGDELEKEGWGKVFKPLFDSLKELFGDRVLVAKLLDAGLALFKKVMTTIGEALLANPKIAIGLFAFLFGPAIMKVVATALMGSITEVLLPELVKALFTGAGKAAFGKAASSIAGSLFNPVVLGAAAAAAIGLAAAGSSKGMEKFYDMLGDQGIGFTERKIGASLAGIIDMITFGLLGDDLVGGIALGLAELSQKVFKFVEDTFGSGYAGALYDTLSSFFDMFSSLGDIVRGIFLGDTEMIEKGAESFVVNLVGYVGTFITKMLPQLVILITRIVLKIGVVLMKLAPKILSGIFALLAGLSKGIGNLLGKIPIIGPILKAQFLVLGEIFSFLARRFEDISKWLGFVGKEIDNVMKFASTFVAGLGAVWDAIWSGNTAPIEAWWEKIKKSFFEFVDEFKTGIVSKFEEIGKNILEGLSKGMGSIGEIFKNLAGKGIDAFTSMFKIGSPSKVTESIGQDIAAGLEKGTNGVPDMFKNMSKDSINEMISKFDGIDTKALKRAKETIDDLASLFEALKRVAGSMEIEAKNIKQKQIKFLSTVEEMFSGDFMDIIVNTLSSGAASLEKSLSADNAKKITDPFRRLNDITEQVVSFTGNIEQLGKSRLPQTTAIVTLVKQINDMSDYLGKNIPAIDIQTKLNDLGKILGLEKKEFTIKHDKVNVTVNLTITLEAETLAEKLLETKKIAKSGVGTDGA